MRIAAMLPVARSLYVQFQSFRELSADKPHIRQLANQSGLPSALFDVFHAFVGTFVKDTGRKSHSSGLVGTAFGFTGSSIGWLRSVSTSSGETSSPEFPNEL